MVRAIIEGRKTQTRRVVNPQPFAILTNGTPWRADKGDIICPQGAPGDRIWVKETFRESGNCQRSDGKMPTEEMVDACSGHIVYAADESWNGPWRPSIFMPRWASRLTLEITSVRVERLQDICPADAISEGTPLDIDYYGLPNRFGQIPYPCQAYAVLWDSLNAQRGIGWKKNPWVWAITFSALELTPA